MANYYGKSPLGMTCPHCEKFGNHRVLRTDPRKYHWSKATVDLFKKIAGSDISYRRRTKRCEYCSRQFDSVEIPARHFEATVREMLRLNKENVELLKLQATVKRQERKLREIAKIAAFGRRK